MAQASNIYAGNDINRVTLSALLLWHVCIALSAIKMHSTVELKKKKKNNQFFRCFAGCHSLSA